MASLKNRAGAVVHGFQSQCERVLKEIDRKRKRKIVGDRCVDCGHGHLILTMTEDGYKCDGCINAPSKVGLVELNEIGHLWTF